MLLMLRRWLSRVVLPFEVLLSLRLVLLPFDVLIAFGVVVTSIGCVARGVGAGWLLVA